MKAELALVANDPTYVSLQREQGPRIRVLLAAQITYASATTKVILREISSSSALIDSPVAPPVGTYVLFSRGAVEVRAQVVGRDCRLVSLIFQEEVDETVLLISIGKTPLISKH